MRQIYTKIPFWLLTSLRWFLLFAALMGIILLITLSPFPILLATHVVALAAVVNFGIAIPYSRATLVSTVLITSLLTTNLQTTTITLAAGLLFGELTHTLWQPLWQNSPHYRRNFQQRLLLYGVYTVALVATLPVATQISGIRNLFDTVITGSSEITIISWQEISSFSWLNLLPFGLYFTVYLLAHVGISILYKPKNRSLSAALSKFLSDRLAALLAVIIAAPTIALLLVLAFHIGGPLSYSLAWVGVIITNLILWNSSMNRAVLRRQMSQFAAINEVGAQLRETLEPQAVIERTVEQIRAMIDVDQLEIILKSTGGNGWTRPIAVDRLNNRRPINSEFEPDDFTNWVIINAHPLTVDRTTMHFAARHNLEPPTPRPAAWLGLPLKSEDELLGVMVLQHFDSQRLFDRWSRELLSAITQQTGDAIQNAQQHQEAMRLYNLTDQQLTRRARQVQAILNSSHEGIIMVDIHGQIVIYNEQAAELVRLLDPGFELAGADGRSLLSTLGSQPEDVGTLFQELQSGRRPARSSTIEPIPVQPGDQNSVYWQSATYFEKSEAPVVGADGTIIGWLLILQDVTEAQERAAWRTQFTHMVVHDLRNPITTLLTQMDILEKSLGANIPDQNTLSAENTMGITHPARLIDNSRRVSRHMLDMVDSLLDVARIEAGQFIVESEAMRLPPIIDAVIHELQPLIEARQISFETDYAEDLPAVWADEELVRRVIVNLTDNAIKYTPSQERILIKVVAHHQEASNGDPGIKCIIADRGPGIPSGERDRIFERFVRVSNDGAQMKGTGIGLSFCQTAIEAQEGEIWVEDNPGGGSRFVFTLPGIPAFDDFLE